MPQKYFIVPVPGGPVDPGYGVLPGPGPVDPDYGIEGPPPEVGGGPLPPLPGIWPPPGRPAHPIALPRPPLTPENPIVIPGTPEHPIQLPPGTIWPPLPPDLGLEGKTAILVWVVGVGKRWFIYDPAHKPPVPEPRR